MNYFLNNTLHKRFFDLILAILILIVSIPFILVILAVVFLITKESPIIIQERAVSLNKKKIRILKIRTIKGSHQITGTQENLNAIYEKHQLESHVPVFCRYLRKSGLDEIPQLVNIIIGEMSFTGPRPLLLNDIEMMQRMEPELYNRRSKLSSKPGLTGQWKVFGNRSLGTVNLTEMDEYYEVNKSTSLDLKLIIRTIIILISATHSDAIIGNKNKKVLNSELINNLGTLT